MLYSRFLVTTIATCCILSAPVLATETAVVNKDPNAPITRAELPGLLKEILLKDPTILMEVVEKMQSAQEEDLVKKSKEGLQTHKNEIFSSPGSPYVGAADADVTLVEFFDYHCGYCKQALITVGKLLDSDKKLRVVFKEYPILSEDSKYGAKAALAVFNVDKSKYFEFHKALFANVGTINEAVVLREAKKLNIDGDKLKAAMNSPAVEKELAQNKELGAAIGARGTPAIIIGDTLYPGAMPFETMQKAIAETRAKK